MAEEIKDHEVAPPVPSAPKAKTKPEKTALILVGASNCTIEDITLKKGERVELEISKAERFLKTGLFVKT